MPCSDDDPKSVSGCLERATLEAFSLGELASAALDGVASHISSCPRCEAVLHEIESDDALVQKLRRCVSTADEYVRSDEVQLQPGRLRGTARLGELPRAFGSYELLEKLGTGGMAVVFKARQQWPRRLVALKVPLYSPLIGGEAVARFRRETEAIARLEHENIVRIYECGEADGLPYFSMEYIEGGTLAQKLAAGPLPECEAARLVSLLARAVHFAHQQGVIHRDLKPSNVLMRIGDWGLGIDQESASRNAQAAFPKLSDFGLAKLLDADDGRTRSQAVMGTAKYMAPEQARGDVRNVGTATDVYGLGAILYECLTGVPPFIAATPEETLRQVASEPPMPPTRLQRGLSPVLEAICVKCLEKDPARRYASAEKLADDLDSWLAGRPTEARPLGRAVRVYRFARQHVAALVLGAAVLITCAVAYWFDPQRPLRQLERKLARGEPIELIGETGRPPWMRIQAGAESTQTSLAADGTFRVHTWSDSLIELLADPWHDCYRVQAQIRHDDSGLPHLGCAGVFVAHRAYRSAEAVLHVFVQFQYDDVRGAVEQRNLIPPFMPKPPPLKGNRPRFSPRAYYVTSRGAIVFDSPVAGLAGPLFTPGQGPGLASWRDVEIAVTPEALSASFDGELTGSLSHLVSTDRLKQNLQERQRRFPGDALLQRAAPEVTPRGALGLYVLRGSASFRRVRVTPLSSSR